MVRTIFRGSRKARAKNARERSPMLKGLLRIRDTSKKLRAQLQEAEIRSWLRFGEAYSALRDWRPIPAALLSHSATQCSGTEEFLPTTTAYSGRPHREKHIPTNQRSIRKKTCSVKLSSKHLGKKTQPFPSLATILPENRTHNPPQPRKPAIPRSSKSFFDNKIRR
jgi:hypothetical protein